MFPSKNLKSKTSSKFENAKFTFITQEKINNSVTYIIHIFAEC